MVSFPDSRTARAYDRYQIILRASHKGPRRLCEHLCEIVIFHNQKDIFAYKKE